MEKLIGSTFATAKEEFDARSGVIAQMAPDVFDAIYGEKPTQQVVDDIILAAKSVSGKGSFSDLFKSDDSIAVGLASLSNGQPPPNQFFLVTYIALQFAIAGGTTNADVIAARYGLIHNLMRNGTIEITQNKRTILPAQSMEQFYVADHYEATGDTNPAAGTAAVYTMLGIGNIGLVKLSNPKWILPVLPNKVDMNFAGNLPADAAVRILYFGARNAHS